MVYRRKFRSSNFRQYGQIGKAQPGRSSDIQKARREWLRSAIHPSQQASNHLWVHQWLHSAIHPSQNQPLLVSYLGNFRHRLVRYYWYQLSMVIWWMVYYCYTHITPEKWVVNIPLWGFPSMWVSKMDGSVHGNSHLEVDDDWGYPYFRKPPYGFSSISQPSTVDSNSQVHRVLLNFSSHPCVEIRKSYSVFLRYGKHDISLGRKELVYRMFNKHLRPSKSANDNTSQIGGKKASNTS